MQLYKTTIVPISNFGTILKGDTLFGQLCWSIRFRFGENKLNELLSNYESNPFLIVSDGFAKGFLPKPSMPSKLLKENSDEKKTNRKKIWLKIEDLQNGNYKNAKTDEEVRNINKLLATVKNSLNYKTFTTDDKGIFSPYSESEISLSPKDVYFAISEKFTQEELHQILHTMSQMGYGKNTTIGKGFFSFSELVKVKKNSTSKTFVTLSPSSLENIVAKDIYYEPFTRFGKHGASLSNKNPFKKPLLLADTGAVVHFEQQQNIDFIGKSIQGHSSHEQTIHQGYAIVIPIKEIN